MSRVEFGADARTGEVLAVREHVRPHKRVWFSGPPPHVGWWNASVCSDVALWRWWNGVEWSNGAHMRDSAERAGRIATSRAMSVLQGNIRWNHRYPANARVPRIAP